MKNKWNQTEIIIFGVGDIGTDLCKRILEIDAASLKCLCDNNPEKQGRFLNGVPVVSPAEAALTYPRGFFLITLYNHTDEVRKQLLSLGIPEEQIEVFTKEDYINDTDRKKQEEKKVQYQKWCEEHNSRNIELKNKYAGKRCFIIGTGGSLTKEDLERLKGEYTFGCNRLYKMFPEINWRPTFYCFYDAQRIRMLKEDLPYILDNCGYLFTSAGIKGELDESLIENAKVYFVHVEKEKYFPKLPQFSEDITTCVYDGQTVLYMAAQIAIYLGFTEIYYLGADNHYSVELNLDGSVRYDSSVKDYPDAIGGMELASSVIPQMELTTMSFEAVKKYASAHGIKVQNATRGGCLEVFERVSYDELF